MGKGNGETLIVNKENGGITLEELYTYYDMFATKGVEYLVIIAFLILIVAFWGFVNMDTRR